MPWEGWCPLERGGRLVCEAQGACRVAERGAGLCTYRLLGRYYTGLSLRTVYVLARWVDAGRGTAEDLAGMTDAELLAQPELGPTRLSELHRCRLGPRPGGAVPGSPRTGRMDDWREHAAMVALAGGR